MCPSRDERFVDFESSLREALHGLNHSPESHQRLRLLLEAVVALSGDRSLDRVLGRIIDLARGLTGARYGAVGVLRSGDRPGLERFVHSGMDEEVVRAIGDPPEGHGLLGLLIEEPEPVRLREMSEDPRSVGFPRDHPRMSSFLGVPIRVGGQHFGNLYLTDKADGVEFSERDERAVIALATAAGVAIESAQAYERARRRESWLEATVEITSALASQVSGQESLELIVERARGVAVADVAWIIARSEGDLSVRAVAGVPVTPEDLQRASWEHSFAEDVVRTGEMVVVPDLAADERSTAVDHIPQWPTLGPAIMLPLRAQGRVMGSLGLGWTPGHEHRFEEVDRDLSASFAEHAALALELQRSREAEQRLTLLQDRDRISHELHDVVIQRIFGTGMSLQGVSHLSDEPVVKERIDEAVEELDATIRDLRRAIFSLGADNGSTDLHGELSHMVARAGGTLKFRPTLRIEGEVNARVPSALAPHLLAVLREVLSNASRHADAKSIEVTVSVDGQLELTVTDDGTGLPEDLQESGLRHIRERAAELGGTCTVRSHEGRGTTIHWAVPLT